MNRAKSAQTRIKPIDVQVLDEELTHQIKKSNLLDVDRTDFWRHAEDIKEKNKQEIERLRVENSKLKHMRDQLMGVKKMRKSSAIQSTETTDENFWRRQYDKEKHNTQSRKNMLLNLQGVLEQLEDNKIGMTEESPLVKNIRILENRLDKVMIKYNEAQSIRKTYEQIAKRLKEERVKYDNELAAIEKTLKGKTHDYQELLLLAHDATHAKEIAQADLKKFQNKKTSVDELRAKYLKEKRGQLEFKKFVPHIETSKEKKVQQKPSVHEAANYKQESSFQKQQLNDYQDAYRKLKQVTGVLDSNEIIQKFKTQGLTTQEFERQKEEYRDKIEKLKEEYAQLKNKLDELKFKEKKTKDNSSQSYLDQIERLETSIDQVRKAYQKIKVKEDRLEKILVNVKVGTKHISSYLDFYKIQHYAQGQTVEQNMLQAINQKVQIIYKVITNDPDYDARTFKQTPSKLTQYFHIQSHLLQVAKNVRLNPQEDESVSEEDLEQSIRLDEKPRKIEVLRSRK